MCFLGEGYKGIQKIQILTFLRVPSIWDLGVGLCLPLNFNFQVTEIHITALTGDIVWVSIASESVVVLKK